MTYELVITREAEDDFRLLKKNEPHVFKKLGKLLMELRLHPHTGTGKLKMLRYKIKFTPEDLLKNTGSCIQ